MNPIDACFANLKRQGRKAFMPFVTAGDPDLDFTSDVLKKIASSGADLIEVGFPFSDPIADGPVIQASYTRALDKGLKLDQIFATLKAVSSTPGWKTPLVGMVSYSIIHRRGAEKFVDEAKASGLSGCVLPDLPGEEAEDFVALARKHDFKTILLVTPTTAQERAAKILKLCSGFLYCVSLVGITGERAAIPAALRSQLEGLRNLTPLPLCVGFGVSKPEQVRDLKQYADGVIVGSALVRKLEGVTQANREQALDGIGELVKSLSGALAG
jgi:tryptophan synthase alpha chain